MVRRDQIQVSMTMYNVLHNELDPLPSIACYVLVHNLLWTMLCLNKAEFYDQMAQLHDQQRHQVGVEPVPALHHAGGRASHEGQRLHRAEGLCLREGGTSVLKWKTVFLSYMTCIGT